MVFCWSRLFNGVSSLFIYVYLEFSRIAIYRFGCIQENGYSKVIVLQTSQSRRKGKNFAVYKYATITAYRIKWQQKESDKCLRVHLIMCIAQDPWTHVDFLLLLLLLLLHNPLCNKTFLERKYPLKRQCFQARLSGKNS